MGFIEFNEENINYKIANLMVFYKGAMTYSDLQNMPIFELEQWQSYALKILEEQKREVEKSQKR